MQYWTFLIASVPRVKCDEHGVRQVAVPWSDPGSRFTALFEALVIDWLREANVRALSRRLRLSWDEVAGGSSDGLWHAAWSGKRLRCIEGPGTGLSFPRMVFLDLMNDELFVASASGPSVTVHAGVAAGDVAPLQSVSGSGTGLFSPRGLATTEAAGGAAGFVILVPEPDAGLLLGVALASCAVVGRSRRALREAGAGRS